MVRRSEFQAVVLAGGKGSRMTELTAGGAKCLLPVGNMPMIWYPLQLLQRSGFTEAIVVVPESIKNDVATVVDKTGLKMKLDLVGIPGEDDLGTADSMRSVHEKIHTDIVIISCDLVTDVDLSGILNSYRKHNASITALMLQVPGLPDKFVTPGPKSKQKPETDLIGIDNKTSRLVLLASASDFEETIDISRKLIKKHTSFTVHSKLMDAHLYVMNKWVLDFLVFNKSFSTLKGELLPYVVGKQLSRLSKPPKECEKNTSIVHMDTKKDIFQFAMEKPLDAVIRTMSAFNDHTTDLDGAYHGDLIRCYAHTETGKFGLRANTVQMYSLANAVISERWDALTGGIIPLPTAHPTATINSTQIENCLIGENALVSGKTSVKQSIVGPNAKIEQKTRVSQSIIMGNVTIKPGCVISNCILCNGSVIEEGSELKDCLVGNQHTVTADSRHSYEVLTDIDSLMEI